MIIQGLNNIASAYGAFSKSAVEGQTTQATTSNYAEKVNISGAGMVACVVCPSTADLLNAPYAETILFKPWIIIAYSICPSVD
jgi:hypothetical protein